VRFVIRFAAPLAAAVVVAACSSGEPDEGYRVAGTVQFVTGRTDSWGTTTGRLAVSCSDGAEVELMSGRRTVATATTRGGWYEFPQVFAGTYQVTLRAPTGYTYSTAPFVVDGADVEPDTLEVGPAGAIGTSRNPFGGSVLVSFYSPSNDIVRMDLFSGDFHFIRTLMVAPSPGPWSAVWDGRYANGQLAPDGAYWAILTGDVEVADGVAAEIDGWRFGGQFQTVAQGLSPHAIHAEDTINDFVFDGVLGSQPGVVGVTTSLGPATSVETPEGRYTVGSVGYARYKLTQYDELRIVGTIDAVLVKNDQTDLIRVGAEFDADPYVEGSLHMKVSVDGGDEFAAFGYETFPRRIVEVAANDPDFTRNGQDFNGGTVRLRIERVTADYVGRYTLGGRPGNATAKVIFANPLGSSVEYRGVTGTISIDEVGGAAPGVAGTFSFVALSGDADAVVVENGVVDPAAPTHRATLRAHELLVKDSSLP